MICSPLFLIPYRWGISQLSPHVPLWLCNQRVWLQVEHYHLFHRRHVLLGPGHGLQERVPWAGPGPSTAYRRRKPPMRLRLMNWWIEGKTTEEKKLHSPLTAIHPSSSEDKSHHHESLDHILLVFVFFFVAVANQDEFKKKKNTFC